MLRKLLLLTLTAVLILTGTLACWAEEDDEINEDLIIETVAPEEPVITEGQFIRVTAEYLAEEGITRHTAELLGNPTFSDGTPLTAQDVLFSLYVYLDPGYSMETALNELSIVGLESYRLQIPEDQLTAAREIMPAIKAAGEDHEWTDADGWSKEQQADFWKLHEEYAAACEVEFPKCAQAIVDYCANMLETDTRGAFGFTSDEIAADEDLRVAYSMMQWGYADAEGSELTSRNSGTVWNLKAEKPTVQDFANELSIAYDGDLAACWAIESTGTYEPELPNLADEFAAAYSIAIEIGTIGSASGIRMVDESTLEIDLEGINMHASLFSWPVLSLNAVGDMEKWSPESGLYGHDFGDVSAIEAAGFKGVMLLEVSDEIIF